MNRIGCAALLSSLLFVLPATRAAERAPGAQHAEGQPCEPGRGAGLGADELKDLVKDGAPLALTRGSSAVAPIDRALLCGASNDDVPCVVPGPVTLACVRITAPLDLRNVIISGDLDLATSALDGGLLLENTQVLGDLILTDADVGGDVVFDRVAVGGALQAERLRVRGKVAASDLRAVASATFDGADVERGVELRLLGVGGEVNASFARAASLSIGRALIQGPLVLHNMRLGGGLTVEQAALTGGIDALAIDVGQDTRLTAVSTADGWTLGGVFRKNLALDNCQLAGGLEMAKSTVEGQFTVLKSRLDGAINVTESHLRRSLKLDTTQLAQGIDLGETDIGEELALIGSRFGEMVDITRARLTAQPRVVACTPANPLSGGEDEAAPPAEEGDQEQPDPQTAK